jgi:flagellar M-ring protein FliF
VQFTKDDILQAAQMGVMALLGLLVLLLVVRPLVRRIVTPEAAQQAARAPTVAVTIGPDGKPMLAPAQPQAAGSGGPNISIVGGEEHVAISNRTSTMIEIAKVQGRVHAESVQKVGELADTNPHEAVSIIRNWLHEDAA